MSRKQCWAAHSISLAILMLAATLVIVEEVIPTPREPADVILKWEMNGAANWAFSKLRSEEPESIEAYRRIMREGNGYILKRAAERLVMIGDPEVDITLIAAAVDRERASSSLYNCADELELIIQQWQESTNEKP